MSRKLVGTLGLKTYYHVHLGDHRRSKEGGRLLSHSNSFYHIDTVEDLVSLFHIHWQFHFALSI